MLTHKGTQALHTDRLLLRPYAEQDAEIMFRNWANDEEVCRFLTWPPHSNIEVTRSLVREWAACNIHDCYYHWGITLAGELIGDIAVVRWSEARRSARSATLGRLVEPGDHDRALTAVTGYLLRR